MIVLKGDLDCVDATVLALAKFRVALQLGIVERDFAREVDSKLHDTMALIECYCEYHALPYPWCRNPQKCVITGRCEREPSCGD